MAFSLAGTASLPIPSLGATLGLASPLLLLTGPADASGALALAVHVPAGFTGVTVWVQALQKSGATPVVKRTLQ